MSEVQNGKKVQVCKGPFGTYKTYVGKSDFDKYYYDVKEVEVFKATGQIDEDGNELGCSEKKLIVKKIDIQEFINQDADSVGVEAYMRALALQGNTIDEFHTEVDKEKVQDFSQMPDNLADTLAIGDNARKVFEGLDPALKGNHTTLEGFLNSLSKESIDSYIKGRIEALAPVSEKKEGE